jgi:hypothetical protein
MGVVTGQFIGERGLDSDCDSALREAIAKRSGEPLFDEQAQEVMDAILLWWRDGDGDLVDELVDALTYLSESGPIWLMTPKAGADGHVEPSDIQEAAPTAGLAQTVTFLAAPSWSATKLVPRKVGKK